MRGLTAFTADDAGRPFELWLSDRQIDRLGGRERARAIAAAVLAEEAARFSLLSEEADT